MQLYLLKNSCKWGKLVLLHSSSDALLYGMRISCYIYTTWRKGGFTAEKPTNCMILTATTTKQCGNSKGIKNEKIVDNETGEAKKLWIPHQLEKSYRLRRFGYVNTLYG